MISADENALMCDFAETYHIYNYKQLPPSLAAVFAVGLPDDSRIKRKFSGEKYSANTLLLACIADRLSVLIWQNTEDGQKNRNHPESILEEMTTEKKPEPYVSFGSAEEFEAARAKLAGM